MSAVGAGQRLRTLPWWLRLFLLVNVVQDFGIAATGLLFPGHIAIPLASLTPLNARFIASLYLGGGVVILLAAFAISSVDARIALISFLAITVLVLAMTLVYWRQFTVDGVPKLWMITYIADPVLAPLILAGLGLWRPAEPGRHRLTPLLLGQAVVFGVVGIALLLSMQAFLSAWPWKVTTLLSRVYAAFFLAFALGAVLSAFERRVAAIRPFVAGSLVLLLSTLVTSLIHLSRFHSGGGRSVWFVVHAVGIALFAYAVGTARSPRAAT
ncbi:MAG: hypothetical protein WCB04_06845 [Mycobacteriales bacterium]